MIHPGGRGETAAAGQTAGIIQSNYPVRSTSCYKRVISRESRRERTKAGAGNVDIAIVASPSAKAVPPAPWVPGGDVGPGFSGRGSPDRPSNCAHNRHQQGPTWMVAALSELSGGKRPRGLAPRRLATTRRGGLVAPLPWPGAKPRTSLCLRCMDRLSATPNEPFHHHPAGLWLPPAEGG